jgi:hypothetical protein
MNRPARRSPAALNKAVENCPVGLRHESRGAHDAARVAIHDDVGLPEMLARTRDDPAANLA